MGRDIRSILPRLGAAFRVFAGKRVHLVSQAANNLSFTFVIDQTQQAGLVQALHDELIVVSTDPEIMGPTSEELYGPTGMAHNYHV